MKDKKFTRRKFVGTSAALMAGTTLMGSSVFGAPAILRSLKKPNSLINGVQIGVITYSYRSMPDQSAEATLKYVLDSGISAIELIGDPAETFAGRMENPVDMSGLYKLMSKKRANGLTGAEEKEFADMQAQRADYGKQVSEWRKNVGMDKFVQFQKMYKDAGVNIYAFKPRDTFGKENSDADIDWGMRTGKALGASHVTVEHPGDNVQTKRLGEMAKKHGIYVAYHGHEQQTPTLWDTALEQSKFNMLNLDLGHYVAAGNSDPLAIIKTNHDRIKSMHLKDRQTPAHDKGNLPWGTGDTPITGALQMIRDNNYKFPATVELEYEIPEGSDAVQEVRKCLEYCKKALA
ncbi:Sugar phosphate isomerase/epimerase [Pricia antarctica]|uniref:Sugar phosphate isomerase/epimerase n=1 Tax=Pricia antarctica TaxID=641691 RepID=A0A1G7IG82_9FLAO|nr:TIM barrel protein [Pricia antarctica]SDF11712.1 Sugar phosphate isomerase/epimerase [Pricia antarctica]